jgi:hypothetical protein
MMAMSTTIQISANLEAHAPQLFFLPLLNPIQLDLKLLA